MQRRALVGTLVFGCLLACGSGSTLDDESSDAAAGDDVDSGSTSAGAQGDSGVSRPIVDAGRGGDDATTASDASLDATDANATDASEATWFDGNLSPCTSGSGPLTSCPVPAVAESQAPASSIAIESWMSEARAILEARPLGEVLLPGTHDSATYGLVATTARPPNDLFAPDANSVIVQLGSLTNITASWSQTQDKSIAVQLDDGIRTVDLRVCLDKSDTFRLCHGLYGPTLDEVLGDVKTFADAPAHSKEIVVLFVDGFTDWTPSLPDGGPDYGNMSAANIDRVRTKIETTLADNLLDHSKVWPTTPLGAIWGSQPGRTVLVVFAREPSAPFWGNDRRTKTWQDTWHRDEKKASLVSGLSNDEASCPHCTLLQFSGEVTDDATLIEASLLPVGTFPKTLRDLADAANPQILGWIRDEWSPAGYRMNAVQMDFYDRTCLVPLMLTLDGVPGMSLAGCSIGTSSNWGSWWNESAGSACVTGSQCASGTCVGACL